MFYNWLMGTHFKSTVLICLFNLSANSLGKGLGVYLQICKKCYILKRVPMHFDPDKLPLAEKLYESIQNTFAECGVECILFP